MPPRGVKKGEQASPTVDTSSSSERQQGASESRAEEIAARTVKRSERAPASLGRARGRRAELGDRRRAERQVAERGCSRARELFPGRPVRALVLDLAHEHEARGRERPQRVLRRHRRIRVADPAPRVEPRGREPRDRDPAAPAR